MNNRHYPMIAAPTSPVLVPECSGVIKLGGPVVRSQCLSGGLAVNATEAFPSIFGLLISPPQGVPQCSTELGNPFAKPSGNLRKLSSPEQNDQQGENQNCFPAAETKKREKRRSCPNDLH